MVKNQMSYEGRLMLMHKAAEKPGRAIEANRNFQAAVIVRQAVNQLDYSWEQLDVAVRRLYCQAKEIIFEKGWVKKDDAIDLEYALEIAKYFEENYEQRKGE